ncbi:MAG: MFS transporter [Candidatus Curtissbacteria bacterium]|nr:MFS transporter [Candidatus Curtissbacteria bacterium]
MEKEDVIEKDLEITAATGGAAPVQLPGKVISVFPALAHRNFQLYFAGQAISLIGFWLQQVGLGFYVFHLTNSPFWVGVVASVGGLPVLLFTTFAGVYIDKVDKQKLLIWTQVVEAAIAFIFGIAVFTHTATLPLIIVLAFAGGTVTALDLPARLTFIVEMVGKKDLASAIPINNGVFNSARFIGPAIAGALIATVGVGWTFILNGLSFIAGIWAISKMRPVFSHEPEKNVHPFESLKIGIKYSFTHPQIFYLMILAASAAIFIWPYQPLMPVISGEVFQSGAAGLGSLLSAAGAGSLTGAFVTSALSRRKNKVPQIMAGLLISSVTMILFSLNTNFLVAHILLYIIGFGVLIQVSTINTLVQLASPDQMRGRVMSVYLTMFVGMMPVGAFLSGFIADRTSALFTIGLGGSAMLLIGTAFYFKGVFKNLAL